MKEIKIICCDIDGTLLTDDKRVTEQTAYWIKRAVEEKGIKFVLVSGRMLSAMKLYYQELGIRGPVACFNGCSLYNENYQLIEEHRLTKEIAQQVLALGEKMGMDVVFFDDQKWYLETRDCFAYAKRFNIYKYDCCIAKLTDLVKEINPNKLIVMHENPARVDEFEKALREEGLGNDKITCYRTPSLEVIPSGTSKGTAVDALSRYFNISKDFIMAVGDDHNDISMLESAGFAVAMGNAVPAVKAVADYVTDTNENNGLAKAIKTWIFPEVQ